MKLFTVEQRKKLLEEELSRIVEVLKRNYEPEKIILFGSLADGDVHEWSDIDLLIVKKTAKRPIDSTDEEAIFFNSIYRARYPADLGLLPAGEPTREDADRALNIAQKMQDWVKEVMG